MTTARLHVFLLVLSLALIACRPSREKDTSLVVVATIAPLASIAQSLVGPRGEVACLLPPGASPHTFEPLPGDVARIARARLLVRVGAGLDEWSEKLLGSDGGTPTIVTFMDLVATEPLPWRSDGPHEHAAGVDPHVWLDPIRVRDALVPALAGALSVVDPAGRSHYQERARELEDKLTELDDAVRKFLAPLGSRRFVAYHDTWRYFAARYGLETVGAIEAYAGDEPTAAELARLIERARAGEVRAVIIEPQLGERVARSIATEIGAAVAVADPLGDPTVGERADYFTMMLYNARAFSRALAGAPP